MDWGALLITQRLCHSGAHQVPDMEGWFMRFDVVGIGRSCIDLFFEVDPQTLSKSKQLIPAEKWFDQGGGSIPTALVALAQWAFRVLFIGKVGEDTDGENIRKELEGHGVKTDIVVEKGVRTPHSIIKLAAADGRLEHCSFEERRKLLLTPNEVREKLVRLKPPRFLLIDCHHLDAELEAALWARDARVPIFLDPGDTALQGFNAEQFEMFHALLELVDIVIGSKEFAARFGKFLRENKFLHKKDREEEVAVIRYIRSLGPSTVIITRGPDDTLGDSKEHGSFRCPVPIVEFREHTGAGDVFHAAFLAFLLRKSTQSWNIAEEATQFANAAAALSCRGIGGRSSVPKIHEIEALLS